MNSASQDAAGARNDTPGPVIGISARRAPVTLRGLDITVSLAIQPHVELLAAAGCVPVVIPPLPGAAHLVARLDGLLIPGGPDVDPALYGQRAHPTTHAVGGALDTGELALLDAAYRAGLPVLAICRGMQLLNVRHGGTLHQHLPEITGDDGHQPRTTAHDFGRQPLKAAPGSRIAAVYGDDPPETACHHHQAVDRIGTGLTATAWTPDGVVEALEAPDLPFVVGVQWEAGQVADEPLHRAFAAAATTHAAARRGGPEPRTHPDPQETKR